MMNTVKAQMGMQLAMLVSIGLMNKFGETGEKLAKVIMTVAAAMYAYQLASSLGGISNPFGLALAVAGGAVGGFMLADMFTSISRTPTYDFEPVTMDTGGMVLPMYDNGGRISSRHFPVMVEPGETIIPKTQNMLGSGITLNIQGDIVTNDAEDFAERIAIALPNALRNINDTGGI